MTHKQADKFHWGLVLVSVLVGALIVLVVRFFTYSPEHTHYHANFAVYLNGSQEKFAEPRYYQPVTACTDEELNNPKARVHMHNNENNVIHVHAPGVTWGQFFENLGWSLSDTAIIDASGKVYSENGQNKLQFILNGQDYSGLGGIANKLVESKDKLLINYGADSVDKAQELYKKIPSTAAEHNTKPDPASCSGDHNVTFKERLEHLF